MKVVLVHGTTQSPAGWSLLNDRLAAAGHDSVNVDLAALSSDANACDYADEAARQVPGDVADVVVAHSGSGLILPAISTRLKASAQVFLAALIPAGEMSFSEELGEDPEAVVNPRWIGADPTHDIGDARHFLFHDCDEATLEWAETTLRLFVPSAVYDEQVPVGGPPATAVVPTGDRTIRPDWLAAAARERLAVEPLLIEGGHCPHVAQPDLVSRIVSAIL
ncbi:MAG: alpha/beta hydrolase [Pseudonocardiaceae bacterium]